MFKSRSRKRRSAIVLAFAIALSLVLSLPGFALAEENDPPIDNGPADLSMEPPGEDDPPGDESPFQPIAPIGPPSIFDPFDLVGPPSTLDPLDPGDYPYYDGPFLSITPTALTLSSNLNDFITGVTIYDLNATAPNNVVPPLPALIGQTYQFAISFAETSQLQLQYDSSLTPPALTYTLPTALTIQNAAGPTPLYGEAPIAGGAPPIIGWYTVSATAPGVVNMWFLNVDLNGNPTPGGVNFIDYYADVDMTFNVFAQLTGSPGSADINFGNTGNEVIVSIDDLQDPPTSLSLHKLSSYSQSNQTITYTITVTVLGNDPIEWEGVWDTPYINGSPINDPGGATSAFTGFTFTSSDGRPISADYTIEDPASLTFDNFVDLTGGGSGIPLVINPGDFITITYVLDLQTLIANNSDLVPDSLIYDFTIVNDASANGANADTGVTLDPPIPQDSTTDHVSRQLVVAKNGVFSSANDSITWTATIGDGVSVPLNTGVITDTLGSGMVFPTPETINIILSGQNGSFSNTYTLATYPTSNGAGYNIDTVNNILTINLPDDTYDFKIYQVVISFDTEIAAPEPGAGIETFTNDVSILLDGIGAPISISSDVNVTTTIGMSKFSSGICGTPDTGYWVEYEIEVTVPSGFQGKPLYIFDDLAVFDSSWTDLANVPNVPMNLTVDVSGDETSYIPLFSTGAVPYADGNNNSWRLFFGPGPAPPDETPINGIVDASWPFSLPATLTVSYRVNLTPAIITLMQGGAPTDFLSNAAYLIDSDGNPGIVNSQTAVPPYNVVALNNVNDNWPIFKTSSATGNPALFNYSVGLNGDYSPLMNEVFLLDSGAAPLYSDTFDARLRYVPNTFYIVDTSIPSPGVYYKPASDVIVSGNSFSVLLNRADWQMFSGTYPTGTLIGPAPQAPAYTSWFAQKHMFQANYQLTLAPGITTTQTNMGNTATITVDSAASPPTCAFENFAEVSYDPVILDKTMAPVDPPGTGSDRFNASIIINADGRYIFSDGSGTGSSLITAQDIYQNLQIFTNTVVFYTQTLVNGVWNGIWTPVTTPITFNSRAAWSVNVVPPGSVPAGYDGQIDFVVPNQQPVMVVYQALVTLQVGDAETVRNAVSIFGVSNTASTPSYVISSTGVGVNAGRQPLRVFKTDTVGNNLHDAQFSLYAMDLSPTNLYAPPGGLPVAMTMTGAGGEALNFGLLTDDITGLGAIMTDVNGVAYFSNPWIATSTSFNFLYLLVETQPPFGHEAANVNSFFTLNPGMTDADILSLNSLLDSYLLSGESVNQLTDFISIANNADPTSDPGSLRIRKMFNGLTDAQLQEYLKNFRIVITDPLGVSYTFGLDQALDPYGIILDLSDAGLNIQSGMFSIREENTNVPGYALNSSPGVSFTRFITRNDQAEVVIGIVNTYTPSPPASYGGADSSTGDAFDLSKYIVLFALSFICLAAFIGRMLYTPIYRRLKRLNL